MQTDTIRNYAVSSALALILLSPLAFWKISIPEQITEPATERMNVRLIIKKQPPAPAAQVPAPPVEIQKPKQVSSPEPQPKKIKAVQKVIHEPIPAVLPAMITEETAQPVAEKTENITQETPVKQTVPAAAEPVCEDISDMKTYETYLFSIIEKNKKYPKIARRKRQQGTSIVMLSMDKTGNMTNISIHKSSGSQILDKEALATVKSVFPVKNESGKSLRIYIPISYTLY